jgi:penicillin G amidase
MSSPTYRPPGSEKRPVSVQLPAAGAFPPPEMERSVLPRSVLLLVGAAMLALSAVIGLRATAQVSTATVTITRDTFGVPHVNDPNPVNASYAIGYAAAQDRLWQLELFRGAGEGRLSEFLGSQFLPMDEVTRRDGYSTTEIQAMYNALPAQLRQETDAFLAGINFYISQAVADPANKLPAEFAGLGIVPQPWQGSDLVAAGVLGIRTFGVGGGSEVDNADFYLQLIGQGLSASQAQGIVNDFFWMVDPAAPTTIPASSATFVFPPQGAVQRFNPTQMAAISRYASSINAADAVLVQETSLVSSLERQLGLPVAGSGHSNAFAISGAFTASGAPLLLGGPQTGIPIPNFFWEIGISTTNYNGAGVTPFGPGFVIGRTADAAYSITSGESDDIDTYIDFLNPANSNQYQSGTVGGQPVYSDMDCRTETYLVKSVNPTSGATPEPPQLVTQQVCRTAHGPAGAQIKCPVMYLDSRAGVSFSRCFATWDQEFNSAVDLVQLGSAQNLAQVESMLAAIAANLNLTYADREGNIAFFHNGLFPIRPAGIDPRFPLLGGGAEEWTGFLPPSSNPLIVNPAQGWLANWNNSPAAGWSALEQREKWGVEDRVQGLDDIIERKISKGAKLTVDDLNQINFELAQKDVFASRSIPYLKAAVQTVPRSDPDYAALGEATTLIDQWLNHVTQARLFHVADQTPYLATVGASGNGLPLIYPPLTVGGAACPNFGCNYPDPGAQLYELWRVELQHDLFDALLGARNRQIGFDNVIGSEENDHANDLSKDAVLLHLLQGKSASLPPSCDYFNNCSPIDPTKYDAERDRFLVNTLREVVHALAAQGLTPDQAVDPVQTETFASESAMSNLTINAMNRGAFNILASLEPAVVSFDVVPPGEAELINVQTAQQNLSDPSVTDPLHITDQLQLYSSFKYKPLTIEAVGPAQIETVPIVNAGTSPTPVASPIP